MTENILVLLLVAAAAVYTVVRLRRVAAGESKCICGSKSCGPVAATCGSKDADKSGGLPLITPSCNQGCGGCGKS
jgi:hypothetical protein